MSSFGITNILEIDHSVIDTIQTQLRSAVFTVTPGITAPLLSRICTNAVNTITFSFNNDLRKHGRHLAMQRGAAANNSFRKFIRVLITNVLVE